MHDYMTFVLDSKKRKERRRKEKRREDDAEQMKGKKENTVYRLNSLKEEKSQGGKGRI